MSRVTRSLRSQTLLPPLLVSPQELRTGRRNQTRKNLCSAGHIILKAVERGG